MIDFNYLVHGSVIFAVGLFLGLIGALISTHGARKEQKKLRKRISELESQSAVAAAPVAVQTDSAASAVTDSTGKVSAQKTTGPGNSGEQVSGDRLTTEAVEHKTSPVRPVETTGEDASESFDHTKVKIATPKTEEHRFDPPNLHENKDRVDPKPEFAPPAAEKPQPVEPDQGRPRIVIDEKRSRAPEPINVVVPPRDKEPSPMPIPRLTPAAATLAADSAASNKPASLNLHVDRDNDVHGRIEPSLNASADPVAMRPRPGATEPGSEATQPPTAPAEQTIWDSHDEVATGEASLADQDLPPINEDGTVGFQTSDEAASVEETQQEPDEETKKRSLRKALLTGGTLMGVDND